MSNFGETPLSNKSKSGTVRPEGKKSFEPRATALKLPTPYSGSRFEPLGEDSPSNPEDDSISDSSVADTWYSSTAGSTASRLATRSGMAAAASPITEAGDVTLESQREDMSILLAPLQNLRGGTLTAPGSANFEDEAYPLSIDFREECRDTGAAPPDQVVRAAMDSRAMARQLKKVRVTSCTVKNDST